MSYTLYEKIGKIKKFEINGKKLQAPETVFTIGGFWGGVDKGRCIQITTDSRGYEQFTVEEIEQIVTILNRWLKEIKTGLPLTKLRG